MGAAIRPGRDSDADGFIALISACWGEYPGIMLDVDGEMPELRALASYYAGKGGALWAAEADGRIVGMIGVVPRIATAPGKSAALRAAAVSRRRTWRHACSRSPKHMRARPARRGSCCGATRGSIARTGSTRSTATSGTGRSACCTTSRTRSSSATPSRSSGIEVLDAAAAASAERRLAEILCACVDAGASVSYLPPLAPDVARAFWQRAATDVAAGTRILLAAWDDAVLVGTVMLEFASSPNQPHRAEVQKLLVHPAARRRGLARALMLRAEQEARRAGRTLLTLDTRAGDAAENLYRAMGWHEAGRIPGYALNADLHAVRHDLLLEAR